MFYMFLGGVFSSSTTLSFKPENLIPMTLCTLSTAVNALDRGIEPSNTHFLAFATGFLIGNIIPLVFGGKSINKKKE